ncbi:MAG: alpha/beta hydrolase [Spirochaetia bacterium]
MKIVIHEFETHTIFGRNLKVRVAIPPVPEGLEVPMLIVHDGQEFFDTWAQQCPETYSGTIPKIERLGQSVMRPIALVGIDTWEGMGEWPCEKRLQRLSDYSPWVSYDIFGYVSELDREKHAAPGGRGEQYAQYIVEHIIPFLEKTYPIGGTKEMRGVAGISMGGMMSLYMGCIYNAYFSRIAVISPALWCFQTPFHDFLQRINHFSKGDRVYLDIGRTEGANTPGHHDFSQIYLEGAQKIHRALQDHVPNLLFYIDEDGEHNMRSIARRFPLMLTYLWGLEFA